MEKRFEAFIIFILLTIITLGLYIPFFWITRQQETIDLLKDIKEELKTTDSEKEKKQVEIQELEVERINLEVERINHPSAPLSLYEKLFINAIWIVLFGVILAVVVVIFVLV